MMVRASSATASIMIAGVALASVPVVVARQEAAVMLAVVALVVSFLALSRDAPLSLAFVAATLGVSATLDLVRRFSLGPFTAYGWVTAALALSAVLLVFLLGTSSVPAAGRRALVWMALFPVWTLLSATWSAYDAAGVQNLLLYALYPSLAAVCAIATASGALTFPVLRKLLTGTFAIGSALYVGSLLADGPGGKAVVDARAYAAFAAVGVAWAAALARHGFRTEIRLGLVMLSLSLVSLSRAAFAVALVMVVLAMWGLGSIAALRRTFATVAAIATLVVAGLFVANPFAARFSEPDVITLPGGVHLSASGRGKLWDATWQSALESPIVGQGPGSALEAVAAVAPEEGHPHNDYLRIFHDFGLVGLGLLGCSLAVAAATSARSLRRPRLRIAGAQALHLASILALTAFALEMVTDNSLVYPFVVGPVAVIVGASLGRALSPPEMHGLERAHP